MDSSQQARATAAQAAAQVVPRGASILDYLSACDVTLSYILGGRDAAIATYFENNPDDPQNPLLTSQSANLVEQQVSAPSAPVVAPAAPLLTSVPAARSKPVEEQQDNVIPDAVSTPVPPKQRAALAIVEKTRRERAQKIAEQASVAKVKAHKDRLLGDMQDANLDDVSVMLKGWSEPRTLGSYLASLYGS